MNQTLKTGMPVAWSRCVTLAVAMALAYLVVCVLPSIRPFWFTSVQSNAVRSIMAEAAASTPLLSDVAFTLSVAVALHLLLAFAAVGLAWLSEAAHWTRESQRLGACFLWFVLLAATVTFLSSFWYPNTHGGDYYGGFGVGHLWFLLWLFAVSLLALPLLLWGRKRGAETFVRWARRLARPAWWTAANGAPMWLAVCSRVGSSALSPKW